MSTQNCTKDTCPASDSIYGYAPQLPANTFFLAFFVVSMIVHGIQGYRYRTWSFGGVMTFGSLCEAIGYGGRLILSNNPFSDSGFKLQIVLLTFSPAFFAAGIYLTLKHLVLTFGSSFSRITPKYYTYIFISCDVLSIIFQGTGGALASAADAPGPLMTAGNNITMAGLSFQVFTLIVFGLLTAEYFTRVRANALNLNPATLTLRESKQFKAFLVALVVAYTAILIRCVYRIAELSQGWGSPIMADEKLFLGLDSGMCALAALLLSAFHPGQYFRFRTTDTLQKLDSDSEGVVGGEGEEKVVGV